MLVSFADQVAADGPSDEWLRQVRFSPDGHYILAQDRKTITVLAVEPLRIVVQLEAEAATLAKFTPDSRQILYISPADPADVFALKPRLAPHPQVQGLEISTGVTFTRDLGSVHCRSADVSPDGSVAVCVDDFGTLSLIRPGSGEVLFQKQGFIDYFRYEDEYGRQNVGDLSKARVRFSPDGHNVLIVPAGGTGKAIAWNSKNNSLIRLKQRLRALRSTYGAVALFAFLDSGHILLDTNHPHNNRRSDVRAAVVGFPDGEVTSTVRVPPGEKHSASDSRFVIVRPFGVGNEDGKFIVPAAAVELDTGRVIISRRPALDVYGEYYATEGEPGEVALWQTGGILKAKIMVSPKAEPRCGRMASTRGRV